MKQLRNKNTGDIANFIGLCVEGGRYELAVRLSENDKELFTFYYSSIKELNENWEDYEDELFYVISGEHESGYECVLKEEYSEICKIAKELGIGFESEKECQKAVEKLKAWKRLRDKGYKFYSRHHENACYSDLIECDTDKHIEFGSDEYEQAQKDLDLLFGGEE